jgi:S-adenosylmethionine:tRNA ribosyltransferase-isomerase
MRLDEFDYELPEELIAQQPLEQRDASRMLVLNRASEKYEDSRFELLPGYVRPGDVVVVNNTRVFPARLIGHREPSGGRVELLLIHEIETGVWKTLARPAQRLKPGSRVRFGDGSLKAEVLESSAKGFRLLRFEAAATEDRSLDTLLHQHGETPLPHYIRRPSGTSSEDSERYQTVFAHEKGAIAAPTAGLHFTPAIISALQARGAQVVEITLHVGYGTFEPVRVDHVEQHRVASESFRVSEETAAVINESRARGGRIIAIGTTTTRALEASANAEGSVVAGAGDADITITPGYKFRVTDGLLTNFHLPRSSLLLLVSAFAGRAFTLAAYRHAVAARYRFYSYGDCMFVM